MRASIIFMAVLGLAACGEERPDYEPFEETPASDNAGPTSPEGRSSVSGDAPASDVRVAARNSCSEMNDPEAFVSCVYAGVGGGWLNTGEAPHGPEVLTDEYWTTIQQMRASFPAWRLIDPLCVCNTPETVRLRSVRVIRHAGGARATAEVVLSGTESEYARLDLVRGDTVGWRVAEVTLHSGPG